MDRRTDPFASNNEARDAFDDGFDEPSSESSAPPAARASQAPGLASQGPSSAPSTPVTMEPPAAPAAAATDATTADGESADPAKAVGVAGAAAAATAVMSDLTQKVMDSPGLMVASIFVLLLIVFVIIYIYVKLKSSLTYYEVLSTPMYLKNQKAMTLASDSSFPKDNGGKFTYAFWVFNNSIVPTDAYKVLMARKDNPIIYMDPVQATMYIRLRTVLADTQGATLVNWPMTTTGATLRPSTSQNPSVVSWRDTNGTMDTTGKYPQASSNFDTDTCHYSNITIKYVPLQRWVHYAVVVDGQYVTVYQDGEINTVLNLATDNTCKMNGMKTTQTPTGGTFNMDSATTQYVSGITKTTGDVVVGYAQPLTTTATTTSAESPDAVVSRIVFFNYAATMQNIADLYNKGPMPQSILSQLGIPMYGVRNPFYRIDSVDVSDPNATSK